MTAAGSKDTPSISSKFAARCQAVRNHLDLNKIDEDRFIGAHSNEGYHQVFGGQLMAQSLVAASQTVTDERKIISYHSTFVHPGNRSHPIEYEVTRIRDSNNFATRRVTALQQESLIHEMTVSFQQSEDGLNYQNIVPKVPKPDECCDLDGMAETYREYFPNHFPEINTTEIREKPVIDMRFVDAPLFLKSKGRVTDHLVWLRFNDHLPIELEQHKNILAYVSDQAISHIIVQPLGLGGFNPKLRFVSLDHAMWFHRPFRADEWLLLVRSCHSTFSGRGIVKGTFYTATGELAASITQEGLMRVKR